MNEVRGKGRFHDDDVYGYAQDVYAHDSLCSETLKRFFYPLIFICNSQRQETIHGFPLLFC